MRRVIFIFIFSFSVLQIRAKDVILNFTPNSGEINLRPFLSTYQTEGRDTIRFDVLRFYVSSISFYNKNKKVFTEKNSFHLIDEETNHQIKLNIPESISFDQIKFNLGIDSITNNSGALGGDLDPTKGMYWTWQSGYINFKLEGTTSYNSDRMRSFEFHLGGYSFPNNSLREISINVENKNRIDILIDLKKFVSQIDFSKINHVMSPGNDAMQLSTILAGCFSAK